MVWGLIYLSYLTDLDLTKKKEKKNQLLLKLEINEKKTRDCDSFRETELMQRHKSKPVLNFVNKNKKNQIEEKNENHSILDRLIYTHTILL